MSYYLASDIVSNTVTDTLPRAGSVTASNVVVSAGRATAALAPVTSEEPPCN